MTLETWISTHPYLRPMGEFHTRVSDAVTGIPMTHAAIPNWQTYADDYKAGIPVLWSSQATIDYLAVQASFVSLIAKLTAMPLSEPLKTESLHLCDQFRGDSNALLRAIAWLFRRGECALAHPGLFQTIGWAALTRYLRPMVTAFDGWRDDDCWLHRYCPVCGSGPSMAQLIGLDAGRRKLLVCACCGTRWRFHRMGCPFCENGNDHRLSVLTIEGEKELRIDFCGSCGGYLKTYDGQGAEHVMLADWTSLHVDLLAKDRGLSRLATSLYEL